MSGAGRRVVAVAVAVAAIGGGLAVRHRDDRGGGGDHGEYTLVEDEFDVDDESTWFFDEAERPDVRCVVELSDVCQDIADYWEMDVTVEPVWATIQGLNLGTIGPDDLDAWVTLAPFDELAVPDDGEPFLVPGDAPIARSTLAGLGPPARIAALRRACLDDVTGLVCAFEQSGRPWSELGGEADWGTVVPVLPDPAVTGVGVLALAVLLEEEAGGRPLTADDLATDEVQARIGELAAARPRIAVDPVEDMARLGPAGGDVTVGADAGGAALVDYGEDDELVSPLVPTYPTRLMTADVELLVTDGYALTDQLRVVMSGSTAAYRFGDHGWETPENGFSYMAETAPVWEDRPTPPLTNQAPQPDVLPALRASWQGATGTGATGTGATGTGGG